MGSSQRASRWGTLGLLLAVVLASGGCGGGGGGGDGAAGKDASTADMASGGGRDGRAPRDTGTGTAGTGGEVDGGGDVPVGEDGDEPTDGGEDGDGPYLPPVPPAICPPIDGGQPDDDGGQGPDGPDNVIFLANATVATLAGTGPSGMMNGTAAEATFGNPVSIAVSPTGELVVCDFDNDILRMLSMPTATLAVTTLTKQAGFSRPYGLTFDQAGILYVDTDFNPQGGKNFATGTIWKVDTTTGVATPIAENIGRPRGLAALPDGRLVLGDYQNTRVRILDPTTGEVSDLAGLYGCKGMVDGKGKDARFSIPYGVAALPDGRVIVADQTNHRLRQVTMDGVVTTFAGDGGDGTVDGPRLTARFSNPIAMAVDFAGDIFVTDPVAHRIRRIAADGTVRTVAGDGTAGFLDGPAATSKFYGIEGITVSPDGKTVWVADGTGGEGAASPYNRIRVITLP